MYFTGREVPAGEEDFGAQDGLVFTARTEFGCVVAIVYLTGSSDGGTFRLV